MTTTTLAASNLGGWPAVTVGAFFLIAVGVIAVQAMQERARRRPQREAQHEREHDYEQRHPPS